MINILKGLTNIGSTRDQTESMSLNSRTSKYEGIIPPENNIVKNINIEINPRNLKRFKDKGYANDAVNAKFSDVPKAVRSIVLVYDVIIIRVL